MQELLILCKKEILIFMLWNIYLRKPKHEKFKKYNHRKKTDC